MEPEPHGLRPSRKKTNSSPLMSLLPQRKMKKIETDINSSNKEAIDKLLKKNTFSSLSDTDDAGIQDVSQDQIHVHNTTNDIEVKLNRLREHNNRLINNNTKKNGESSTNTNENIINQQNAQCTSATTTTTTNITVSNMNSNTKNNTKLPPINIFKQNTNLILNAITQKLKIKNFYIKKINSNKQAIHTHTLIDFNTIKELLIDYKVPFFTYTPTQNKNKTFILKGLNTNENNDQLLVELKLKETDTLKFIKVSNFTTKNSKKNGKDLPFYIVQISYDSSVEELKKIEFINYQVVQWDKLRKSDITQCFKCQRFGHTATNCQLYYRCVKCNDNHNPGECTITAGDNNLSKIFCVQCQTYGHPASYRGCPRHVELSNKLKKKKEEQQQTKIQRAAMHNNYINPNVTFASMFNNSNPQSPTIPKNLQGQQQFNQQQPDITSMFNQIMQFLRDSINDMRNEINNQNKKIDIICELGGFDFNAGP